MLKMKYIIVTGGAGFIGSNLIKVLSKSKSYKIISLDNYFTGSKKNHIISKNIQYINGDTINISRKLEKLKNKIKVVFHFAEFSRIAQSFDENRKCFKSNILGSYEVINFCLKNNIKIIYSATSASLGNNGQDQNLSPYAFSKSNNMNLIMNLNEWFGLKYEIIYFYNVYGPNQIYDTFMAAVVGIFEKCFIEKKSFPVVRPGTQSRKFTHVEDTVNACIYAWKKNKNAHYSISNDKSYSIINLARMFGGQIKFLPQRRGERFQSSVINRIRDKKIIKLKGQISLKKYINKFKEENK